MSDLRLTVLMGGLGSSLLRLGIRGFQIADQALKGFLVGVVVLPVAEVGDEIP
jgi:hypothetical protein